MKKTVLNIAVVMASIVLVSATVQAKEWATDFEKASTEAKSGNKYMLLNFTGSDWCGWCIKLDKEVFSKKEFKEYAAKDLVCVFVDFPRKKKQSKKVKKQNAELSKKYKIRGYPTIIVLDPDGKLVGQTGYAPGGPKKYIKHLQKMIDAHKAKAAKKNK